MNKPLPYQDCVMILIIACAILLAFIFSGCASFDGKTISYPPVCNGVTAPIYDDKTYLPTIDEAHNYVFQCGGRAVWGDCDDNANRCTQACRDLFNRRARTSTELGLGVWTAAGYWRGRGPHATTAFYTTDKGWQFYDASLKRNITDEYVFWRFL